MSLLAAADHEFANYNTDFIYKKRFIPLNQSKVVPPRAESSLCHGLMARYDQVSGCHQSAFTSFGIISPFLSGAQNTSGDSWTKAASSK